MGLNKLEIIGAVGQGFVSWRGRQDAKRRAEERRLRERETLAPDQWGAIRPDYDVLERAVESSSTRYDRTFQEPDKNRFQTSVVNRRGTPDTMAQRLREAMTNYRPGAGPEGFDPDVYYEIVEWARVNDPDLWEQLTGGEGQSVLRGLDPETGELRGPDPTSLHPDALAAHREAGTYPDLPLDATATDIQRLLRDDFARTTARYDIEVEQTEKFQGDVEALLGRGGELHADISEYGVTSRDAISGIESKTIGGIDTARRENAAGRDRLRGDIREGFQGFEDRRSRGVGEFVDDTAQRIEVERRGLNDDFRSDVETTMQEMQAQGMSQREIMATLRTKNFDHREKIANIVMKHNIAVASERSDLGLAYDELTSSYAQVALGEIGALERANVGAESGFAVLTAQAAEATARYTIQVERDIVSLRGQTDFAYLNNNVVLGNMLSHLSETMPQASEWSAASWSIRLAEDAIDQGFFETGQAYAVAFFDNMSRLGSEVRRTEIAETQAAATESAAQFGMFGSLGGAAISTGGLLGAAAITGGGGEDVVAAAPPPVPGTFPGI